ncbi:hypothetical protein D3C79_755630 [compost metagenome]
MGRGRAKAFHPPSQDARLRVSGEPFPRHELRWKAGAHGRGQRPGLRQDLADLSDPVPAGVCCREGTTDDLQFVGAVRDQRPEHHEGGRVRQVRGGEDPEPAHQGLHARALAHAEGDETGHHSFPWRGQ